LSLSSKSLANASTAALAGDPHFRSLIFDVRRTIISWIKLMRRSKYTAMVVRAMNMKTYPSE